MKNDDDLNALFAEHVAKVKPHIPTEEEIKRGSYYCFWPAYTTDANAVLPWLVRFSHETFERDGGEPEVFRIYSPAGDHDVWTIQQVWLHHDGDIEHTVTKDKSFPRAAVIALLRAKGVEV